MALRFRRRVGVVPGLRVNLSRSGPSLSIGRRGAWFTVGPRGRRATVGLPGTGLFWTECALSAAPRHAGHRGVLALGIIMLALAAVLWALQCANG